jgi:hypothetical protein
MMADGAVPLMKQNIKLRGKSFSLVCARQAKGAPLIATFAPEKRVMRKSILREKNSFSAFKFWLVFDISLFSSLQRIFMRPGIQNCISQVLINKSPTHTPRFYHFPFNFTAPSLSRVVKFLHRILCNAPPPIRGQARQ